jgi:hypothetical protein
VKSDLVVLPVNNDDNNDNVKKVKIAKEETTEIKKSRLGVKVRIIDRPHQGFAPE